MLSIKKECHINSMEDINNLINFLDTIIDNSTDKELVSINADIKVIDQDYDDANTIISYNSELYNAKYYNGFKNILIAFLAIEEVEIIIDYNIKYT